MTSSPKELTYIKLENLKLDRKNPRLPSTMRKSKIADETIVNWMLQDASIVELMLAIGQSGFFVGESLLVVKRKGGGNYDVVEGNRRLTSLMLLDNPDLAKVHKRKIAKVLDETSHRPKEVPCVVFESRADIEKYLGYRHVTGIKSWSVLSKARYLTSLKEAVEETEFSEVCRILAKSIGSRSDYVKKLLVSYEIYQSIEDEGFFRISGLDETSLHFNYISDSIGRENIRSFINVDMKSETPAVDLDIENLDYLMHWFFEKNSNLQTRVKGDSKSLSMLDEVLGHDDAKDYFIGGSGSIEDAYTFVSVSADAFHSELELSLSAIKRARSIAHRIKKHHSSDILKLKEIFDLTKDLKAIIKQKDSEGSDDWNNV
ncbi:MAG: hypothetical protein OIF57_18390 [Marinobacterium sp.]|nr:hypothetical protein [Marinobacterium sp.]